MNQLLNTKKPTTEQQIAFVRSLRTETVRVLKTSEMLDMLKAIEENLVAVKLWNQAHAGTCAELVAGVGKAADFMVLDHEEYAVLKEFIGTVFLMRQAQEAFDIMPSGSHLQKKLRFEKEVDKALDLLITPQVREEWAKRKEEVSHG